MCEKAARYQSGKQIRINTPLKIVPLSFFHLLESTFSPLFVHETKFMRRFYRFTSSARTKEFPPPLVSLMKYL